MKIKLLSLVLLASIGNFSCIQTKGSDGANGSDIMFSHLLSDSGKGDVIEKSYDLSFNELEISTSLKAEVYKSDKERIVVYAPSDLMQYVVVKHSGGKVQVKIQTENMKSISTDRMKIKVYAKNLTHLSANSSGNISLKDDFNFSDIDVKVSSSGAVKGNINGSAVNIQTSSSGNFNGNVNAKKLNLQTSSSGDISVKGKANQLTAQASSSGDINGSELTVESAVITTSSSADVTVGVSTSVTASASSSGDIRILKRGSLDIITKNESSSGSVSIQ